MSFLVKYEVYGVKYELQRGIFDLCERHGSAAEHVMCSISDKKNSNPESWTNKESLFLSRPLSNVIIGGK